MCLFSFIIIMMVFSLDLAAGLLYHNKSCESGSVQDRKCSHYSYSIHTVCFSRVFGITMHSCFDDIIIIIIIIITINLIQKERVHKRVIASLYKVVPPKKRKKHTHKNFTKTLTRYCETITILSISTKYWSRDLKNFSQNFIWN